MSVDKLRRETDFGGGYVQDVDLPLPAGSGFAYRDANGDWAFTGTPGTGVGWFFRKSYTKNAEKPYVYGSDSSYKTVTVFAFPGTNSGAAPNRVRAVVSSKGGDGNVAIRIVDITAVPPQVILEKTPLAVLDEDPREYDLGVVANLPAAGGIFEIQIKKVSKKCLLHDILIDRS